MHEGLIGEIQISSCSWLQTTGSTRWMIDAGQTGQSHKQQDK
jgi:hypothetical protein